MDSEQLQTLTIDALDEIKAVDVVALDVRRLTSIADSIVIASGTSQRHVQSLADNVLQRAREAGIRPLGVEGEQTGDWVLVDLGDVIVHVMRPEVRDFYNLEKLWDVAPRSASVEG
ncbi:ribosome silencing factor [Candidatus Macondimonas diazotrophica]|jgi:ribosome-associated protein|uniref:Ribosomal silencing factor RsfS n=1 Tax=Candidatus Macondimonas diazotrophica TaxID=2305248 RepID=A0A4Z0FDA5_9GAMM|nr:ribosome silencing factor [Candidatus Macondimonas diazotrophica]NCT99938.1 ribosome silencing factor [Candidatus Macondimonas diazotrophica]TFZ83739.1 ribosome silencing factor [Candidatus Macondimonas diazotrophica]HBG31508.1 ribosome silencing factor [Gammaproteobacteria bacterium]HBG50952.1 ribosome silencing factor [Gammaproteobacteria bacterium]